MGDPGDRVINPEVLGIGQRLRGARKGAGYTLESAAAALTDAGIQTGKAAVGHWETGLRTVDGIVLRRLCRLYRVSANSILLGEDRDWPFSEDLYAAIKELDADDIRHAENAVRSVLRLDPLARSGHLTKVKSK